MASETFIPRGLLVGMVVLDATVSQWRRPGRCRCPCSGHQHRADAASQGRTAEFQGFPPGASTAGPPMSAAWSLSRWRDRVRGLCGRCGRLWLRLPLVMLWFKRRFRPDTFLSPAYCERVGCAGQGVVHTARDPPTLVQYAPGTTTAAVNDQTRSC